jgi:hypothetical protein
MKQKKTLARSSILRHKATGVSISTPLLVPSFSSKGFYIDSNGSSDVNKIFKAASEYITDSMLISAYDIYKKNINIKTQNYKIAEITIVDSGGYEVSDDNDLSTIIYSKKTKNEWTEDMLFEVYRKIPANYPVILVNYDHPEKWKKVKKQINDAKALFQNFPYHLHTILIKPEAKKQRYIEIESILQYVKDLANFDIIGFTEKELGNSILMRMITISNIRQALDNAGISIPIHIYGSLDPITSILYFISGAEIFDGLAWIRYGFLDGNACYYQNYGVRTSGIDWDMDRTKLFMLSKNLLYLKQIKNQMKKFLLKENFSVFGKKDGLSQIIESAHNLLKASIGGIN